MSKYFGFKDRDDVASQFQAGTGTRWNETFVPAEDFPTDEQILFASYGGADYTGDATVIFERDGKLFEVNQSHCSCYGLEDGWTPEETSWEGLALRKKAEGQYDSGPVSVYEHGQEAHDAFWNLVNEHKSKE